MHIMPDFSKTPLNSNKDVEDWLHFFNMSAPLINAGTLVSSDPVCHILINFFKLLILKFNQTIMNFF